MEEKWNRSSRPEPIHLSIILPFRKASGKDSFFDNDACFFFASPSLPCVLHPSCITSRIHCFVLYSFFIYFCMTHHPPPLSTSHTNNPTPWRDYNENLPSYHDTQADRPHFAKHSTRRLEDDYKTTLQNTRRRPKKSPTCIALISFLDETGYRLNCTLCCLPTYLTFDYTRYYNGPLSPLALDPHALQKGRRVPAKVHINRTKGEQGGLGRPRTADRWRCEHKKSPTCRAIQTRTLRPLRSQVCFASLCSRIIAFLLVFVLLCCLERNALADFKHAIVRVRPFTIREAAQL